MVLAVIVYAEGTRLKSCTSALSLHYNIFFIDKVKKKNKVYYKKKLVNLLVEAFPIKAVNTTPLNV